MKMEIKMNMMKRMLIGKTRNIRRRERKKRRRRRRRRRRREGVEKGSYTRK